MPSRRNRIEASWGRASDFSEPVERATEIQKKEIIRSNQAYKLSYFKACLFATTLEDIISKFRILDECNSQLRINKTIAEMPKLLAHKYGVKEKSIKEVLDDVDPKNFGCMEYKLEKLQSDRNLVINVLKDTYLDLAKKRNFHSLNVNVCIIVEAQAHLNNLMEIEANNKSLRRELNRQLRQQRNHIKSVTYDTNNEIEFLKSGLEDSDLNAEIRSRYVNSWQRARNEQHLQRILDKETKPLRTIDEFKRNTEHEQRAHSEIELLINIKINEILIKIEEWMNKYDKDIEQMDLRVQLKKNAYEHVYDKKLELEETIANHAELINNWVTYKEEREVERQYRERINNAAVTVQAWWRGLLVRQQLGPYKPVKRRPATKPEEKAGKKKK